MKIKRCHMMWSGGKRKYGQNVKEVQMVQIEDSDFSLGSNKQGESWSRNDTSKVAKYCAEFWPNWL